MTPNKSLANYNPETVHPPCLSSSCWRPTSSSPCGCDGCRQASARRCADHAALAMPQMSWHPMLVGQRKTCSYGLGRLVAGMGMFPIKLTASRQSSPTVCLPWRSRTSSSWLYYVGAGGERKNEWERSPLVTLLYYIVVLFLPLSRHEFTTMIL